MSKCHLCPQWNDCELSVSTCGVDISDALHLDVQVPDTIDVRTTATIRLTAPSELTESEVRKCIELIEWRQYVSVGIMSSEVYPRTSDTRVEVIASAGYPEMRDIVKNGCDTYHELLEIMTQVVRHKKIHQVLIDQ